MNNSSTRELMSTIMATQVEANRTNYFGLPVQDDMIKDDVFDDFRSED